MDEEPYTNAYCFYSKEFDMSIYAVYLIYKFTTFQMLVTCKGRFHEPNDTHIKGGIMIQCYMNLTFKCEENIHTFRTVIQLRNESY